ncbi:MAG: hypothetical protein Q9168_002281 [Polycauliona sp. 1 TL-2023]
MSRYRYCPLPPVADPGNTPTFTRLLLLAPGTARDSLRGSLVIVDIQNAPSFEALSYCWGSDPAEQPLLCHGQPLSIRRSLELALRSLRLPDQPRALWVDALCIDQSSTEERSRQVAYMRLVYKSAARTIIWLGIKTPGIHHVFHLSQTIAEIKVATATAYTHINDTSPDPVERELDTITEILDAHPQVEVVVSASCIAKCEDLEIDFISILSTAIHVSLRRTSPVEGVPLALWNAIYLMKQPGGSRLPGLSKHDIQESIGPILSVAMGTRDFKATDPRDKIFSILGIADEGLIPVLASTTVVASDPSSLSMRLWKRAQRGLTGLFESINQAGPNLDLVRPEALRADYSKGVVEVYRDFARFMMRNPPGLLTVLSCVQHLGDSLSDSFPSWVPKWHQPRSVSPIGAIPGFLAGLCDDRFPHFAVLHDSPLTNPSFYPNTLSLDGYFVDRIVALSIIIQLSKFEWPPVEDWYREIFGTRMLPLSRQLSQEGDLPQLAFCKTLSAGLVGPLVGAHMHPLHLDGKHAMAEHEFQAHADAAAYLMRYQTSNSGLPSTELASLSEAASTGSLQRYLMGLYRVAINRRVYRTQSGLLGLGPKVMKRGDEVCVLFGASVPFVLRRVDDHHLFAGDTYIHDDHGMWGKLTEGVKCRKQLPVTTYNLH